jgi:hypothetical protein
MSEPDDLHIRTEKDVVSEFNKDKSEFKLTSGELLKKLLDKTSSLLSAGSQLCPCYAENSNSRDRKDVNVCLAIDLNEWPPKRGKVEKLVKRVFCDHHYLHMIIDPATQENEQIKQENVKLKAQRLQEEGEYTQKVVKLEERAKNAKAEWEKVENSVSSPEELEKAKKRLSYFETEFGKAQNSIKAYEEQHQKDQDHIASLQKELRGFRKLENMSQRVLPEEKTRTREEELKKKPSDSIDESHPQTQVIERTVEKAKTTETEKVTTKLTAPIPSEPPNDPDQTLCPFNGKIVSVNSVCKKTCEKWADCPKYLKLIKNEALQNAKTRPRASEP